MLDKPNERKKHRNSVPLVGGISIYFASFLSLALILPLGQSIMEYKNTFIATSVLMLLGLLDDRYDLNAKIKLLIQLILAHFVFTQGIKIESMHGLLGIHELPEYLQYILTILIITGVVNAFNLMDGVDGLAAGLAMTSFIVLIIIAFFLQQNSLIIAMLGFIGSLLAFLRYNLSSQKKVFLGDAGSLMIGFLIVVIGIKIIQSAATTSAIQYAIIAVTGILSLPVFDALRVFRKRMKSGFSPFKPDRTHLHHLFLTIGQHHMGTTVSIVLLSLLITGIGFLTFWFLGLAISLIAMIFGLLLIMNLLSFQATLVDWKNRIKEMENQP
ncbi:MAG: MraY family glycosyltransferase [Cecembia sp.]